jgi:hypothetical protein
MRAAAVAVLLGAAALLAGCESGGTALFDSLPIALARAPMGGGMGGDGALIVRASVVPDPDAPISMLLDTGTPLTAFSGVAPGTLTTFKGGFDLRDDSTGVDAVRASFRNFDLLRLPLAPVGDDSVTLGALFGGDVLRLFSIDLRLGAPCSPGSTDRCASVTFWRRQNAEGGFLQDAGYAVLKFSLTGGGEVTAQGDSDFLGTRGPLALPATRVVLRGCVVPLPFAPSDDLFACCQREDANKLATTASGASGVSGANLALLVATGVGPVILGEAAWGRVVTAAAAVNQTLTAPVPQPASLWLATWPTPLDAAWTTIPRMALVDAELGTDNDPGACVELARARRIEQVSYRTVNSPDLGTCVQPCDTDPRQPTKAQNSAAYLELGGQIPVAVIADTEPFLQGLRFDVRPEGPEVDGLLGAGALGGARVEFDYGGSQPRAIFSCETDAQREACWAAARCPRLPTISSQHVCFGLPSHGLPARCDMGGDTALCQ